jgi:hypothetical protein
MNDIGADFVDIPEIFKNLGNDSNVPLFLGCTNVRPFFARSAPPLGDGMRKKDTEIPPKRAFV